MSQLLYYLLLKPVSYLPYRVLYGISDGLFVLFYYLLRFRKKVVLGNLTNSFPEKSHREIEALARAFYRHFGDLLVESIKMFSISEAELRRRCLLVNTGLLNAYYEQGKSIFIVAGHYNNWEMAAVVCDLHMKHQAVGIYAPLSNSFFDKKLQESRTRFGLELVHKKQVRTFFAENRDRLTATMFGADQSPTYNKKVYWTRFLNQDTAVMFGVEKYAKEYNYPVVFGKIHKVKRGFYEFEFVPLEEEPASSPYGAITEKHTRLLEEEIRSAPAYWLWTHKRWKRKKSTEAASETNNSSE